MLPPWKLVFNRKTCPKKDRLNSTIIIIVVVVVIIIIIIIIIIINLICTINSNYRIPATLYSLRTGFL